ncbi:MAG: DUF3470 domain-containing protein [Candidatus Hodgkinia cicadicola]
MYSLASVMKPNTEPNLEKWVEVNSRYSKLQPNVPRRKPLMVKANELNGVKNKFEKCFDTSDFSAALPLH